MIPLPWSCVTALKLEPVGPISAGCFGLRYLGSGWGEDREDGMWQSAACFTIVDLPRARQTREIWGTLQYDPRVIQQPYNPEKHPTWTAFCQLHLAVTEGR